VKTILVVDDEQEIADAIRAILEDEGYAVQACRDGLEAVELLQTGAPPALVLSDVMMPRLGGLDLVNFVRHAKELRDLPIVLMSSVTPGVKRANAQWNAFLKKPFRLDDLLTMVSRYAK
jgi:CheY-like chemotaxis protein